MGTWQSQPGEVEAAVKYAVKIGYRHLDLAKVYGNQHEVGAALQQLIPSVVKREDLFITSKLWNNAHRPEDVEPTLDDTLIELGVEYLDLYLMHWPVGFDAPPGQLRAAEDGKVKLNLETSVVDTWKALIELKKTGKVKSIGVSNFRTDVVDAIIKATGVAPAVNQIEAHPLLPQDGLVKHHKEHNIHITAYAPLGNNPSGKTKVVDYPQVAEIAKKRGADPGQVLLAWGVHRGYSVIPKSVTPVRIESNFKQIELTDEEYKTISDIIQSSGGHVRFFTPYGNFNPLWDINVFNEEAEKAATHQIKIE